MITNKERLSLQDLAKQVRDIASMPIQEKRIQRWKDLNALKYAKPLVHFIYAPQTLRDFVNEDALIMKNDILRDMERELKWRIFKAENLRDDEPISNELFVPLDQKITPWMEGQETVRLGANYESSHFEPCFIEYSDIKKMCMPELVINSEKSNFDFELAKDIFGDILNITQGVPFKQSCGWGESMVDELAEMRGLEQMFYDFIDEPEFIHEVMEFMTQGKLRLLEQYKEQQAMFLNNKGNCLGSCGLAYTDELPGSNFDSNQVRPQNLWGFAQAQELSSVSPPMLEEFVLPYMERLTKDFGLLLYGCCEPMEHKIQGVKKQFKNLRAFSIGPFTNHELAAPQIKGDYVYTWKQNASLITKYDPQEIEADITKTFKILAENKCCSAIVLMDVYDYGKDISRLQNWISTAQKIAEETTI